MPDTDELVVALRKTLQENAQLWENNRALQLAAEGRDAHEHEPIAIVGMACRFPGDVRSADDLWSMVSSTADGITEVPLQRGWDSALFEGEKPSSTTRYGGWLHDADEFDPEFFGISPREALAMDPQQRLFLETTWRSLEDAGIDPRSLKGSRTGVWGGVMYHDYAGSQAGSFLSGRVSYTLGLDGPAISVDTACSSSLVAVHLACQSLRRRETSLAIAGGATVMSTPSMLVYFSTQGGLAPDGRCKAYSESADGTGWGEGVGVLVLERLSDARRLGHHVWALVCGSATNSDGASSSMTTPNGPAQQRVISAALDDAGFPASSVDLLEGHGTGTRLGDPIEIQALLATYGRDRDSGRPAWLGSVKSNIGHTQAAAGVAGVIKAVQAMRYMQIPPTLHVGMVSRQVDWAVGGVQVADRLEPWPRGDNPRRAAVSSFGLSGTNAHLVLEEAPQDLMVPLEPSSKSPDHVVTLILSAATKELLAELQASIGSRTALGDHDQVAAVLATRAALPERAVVICPPGFEGGILPAPIAQGTVGTSKQLGLVLGDDIDWWLTAGRSLWSQQAFRLIVDQVVQQLGSLAEGVPGCLAQAEEDCVASPSILMLVVACGISGLLERWGVATTQVRGEGHSRMAAAYLSGQLRLEDITDGAMDFTDIPVRNGAQIWFVLAGAAEPSTGTAFMLESDAPLEAGLHDLLAKAWCAGLEVDWMAVVGRSRWPAVAVPGSPMCCRKLWMTDPPGVPEELGQDSFGHPLLPCRSGAPSGMLVYTGRVNQRWPLWCGDHRVSGKPLLPGAAMVEMALAVGREVGLSGIDELVIHSPVELGSEWTRLRLEVYPVDRHRHRDFSLWTSQDGSTWHERATGRLVEKVTLAPGHEPAPSDAQEMEQGAFYEMLAERGLQYGPSFQALEGAVSDGSRVWAQLRLPDGVDPSGYLLHPTLLDAAFHALSLRDGSESVVPFSWAQAEIVHSAVAVQAMLSIDEQGDASVVLADEQGRLCARVGRVSGRPLSSVRTQSVWMTRWRMVPPTASAVENPDVPVVVATTDDPLGSVMPVVRSAVLEGNPLIVVTSGAWHVEAGDTVDPRMTAVWGLVRSAEAEAPGTFTLVDVASGDSPDLVRSAGIQSREAALRGGAAFVPELVEVAGGQELPVRGTILITGGTGSLGAVLARHLAGISTVTSLVLVSRSGAAAEGCDTLLADLRELGITAQAVSCDVANATALAEVLGRHQPDLVIHAAGSLADVSVTGLDQAGLELTLGKAWAAEHLDRLLPDDVPLVVLSSVAGLVGSSGQANYAAANAWCDGIVMRRVLRGAAGLSLQLGPWRSGMMLRLTPRVIEAMEASGIPLLDAEEGLSLVNTALRCHGPVLAPIRVDRKALSARPTVAPVLESLVQPQVASEPVLRDVSVDVPAHLTADQVLTGIRECVAQVLGFRSADEVDPHRAFDLQGVDSVTAVELRSAVNKQFGVRLPATLVFDHPTVADVASRVCAELGMTEQMDRPAHLPENVVAQDDPVVIVGMGCHFPGGVDSPDDLWEMVAEERDVIGPFPTDRGWDPEVYHPDGIPGTSATRQGGFLLGAAHFDADFFAMSPREALDCDPQQRLLLQTTWEALEHAGIQPAGLRGSRTAVYAGVMYHDYAAGSAASMLSGRISYVFGLEGPCVSVDTACSSSLVTLHLAVDALRAGECEIALAGGVTVMSTPQTFIQMTEQGGLSPDGRCRAFGADADGTGWSEGVGVLVLERLSSARARRHRVLAVVRGSAVNSDGASNGFAAPSGPAQQKVIHEALARAGLGPADVSLIEGHGTATRLGDPIEIQALLSTYGTGRASDDPAWLGSIKSNMGHTQAAAGVAGVIKAVQSMQRGIQPRSLGCETPSSHVDWTAGAVRLLDSARPWPPGVRRAAVSSFGISGTNAHVVLEQAPAADAPAPTGAPAELVVPLSARTLEQLRRLAKDLVKSVARVSAPAVARAMLARTAFDQRVAVVGSPGELAELLSAIADGSHETGTVLCGGCVSDGLLALARRWCRGEEVAWPAELTADDLPAEWVPAYPFAENVYWRLPEGFPGRRLDHPILSSAIDLPSGEVLVVGSLSARVPAWVADHVIEGQVLYPGAGLIDLALTVGRVLDAPVLQELVIGDPLFLGDHTTHLQVRVGAEATNGRTIEIWSQDAASEWHKHATGVLAIDSPVTYDSLLEWPPAGAQMIDAERPYEELDRLGYHYGPAFRAFARGWSLGRTRWAEVELPSIAATLGCTVPPALLDAAMHVAILNLSDRRSDSGPLVPFVWNEVRVHAPVPNRVRVRVTEGSSADSLGLLVADGAGRPVLSVGSLLSRPLQDHASVTQPVADALFSVEWTPWRGEVEAWNNGIRVIDCRVLEVSDEASQIERANQLLVRLLRELQEAKEEQVVVVTSRAFSLREGEQPEPAHAAVWGLCRAAEAEQPGTVRLVDLPPGVPLESCGLIPLAEAAWAEGQWWTPILAASTAQPCDPPSLAGGPVLVTGGTGAIGAVLAEHLVERYGVTELVLASRRGPAAPGAAETVAALAAKGAQAQTVAVDLTDEQQVRWLVDEHQPVAVVHCAGIAGSQLMSELSEESLTRVLDAKARSAWLLHEATRDRELTAFVVISSAGGLVMAAGQGAYAAANVFCDSLVQLRRSQGLPATALAYGLWDLGHGMSAQLTDMDRLRLVTSGTPALSVDMALALFDAGLASPRAELVPLLVDREVLQQRAASGASVNHLLSTLLPTPSQPASPAIPASTATLSEHLAGLPLPSRRRALADLVGMVAATVLRLPGAVVVSPTRPFDEMGFDSLSAVELRNELGKELGLRLPATLVFDHPTVNHMVGYLLEEMGLLHEDEPAPFLSVAPDLSSGTLTDELDEDLATADLDELLSILDDELDPPTSTAD